MKRTLEPAHSFGIELALQPERGRISDTGAFFYAAGRRVVFQPSFAESQRFVPAHPKSGGLACWAANVDCSLIAVCETRTDGEGTDVSVFEVPLQSGGWQFPLVRRLRLCGGAAAVHAVAFSCDEATTHLAAHIGEPENRVVIWEWLVGRELCSSDMVPNARGLRLAFNPNDASQFALSWRPLPTTPPAPSASGGPARGTTPGGPGPAGERRRSISAHEGGIVPAGADSGGMRMRQRRTSVLGAGVGLDLDPTANLGGLRLWRLLKAGEASLRRYPPFQGIGERCDLTDYAWMRDNKIVALLERRRVVVIADGIVIQELFPFGLPPSLRAAAEEAAAEAAAQAAAEADAALTPRSSASSILRGGGSAASVSLTPRSPFVKEAVGSLTPRRAGRRGVYEDPDADFPRLHSVASHALGFAVGGEEGAVFIYVPEGVGGAGGRFGAKKTGGKPDPISHATAAAEAATGGATALIKFRVLRRITVLSGIAEGGTRLPTIVSGLASSPGGDALCVVVGRVEDAYIVPRPWAPASVAFATASSPSSSASPSFAASSSSAGGFLGRTSSLHPSTPLHPASAAARRREASLAGIAGLGGIGRWELRQLTRLTEGVVDERAPTDAAGTGTLRGLSSTARSNPSSPQGGDLGFAVGFGRSSSSSSSSLSPSSIGEEGEVDGRLRSGRRASSESGGSDADDEDGAPSDDPFASSSSSSSSASSSKGAMEAELEWCASALHVGGVRAVSVCAGRPLIATIGESDACVIVWDYAQRSAIAIRSYPTAAAPVDVSFHPSGHLVAVAVDGRGAEQLCVAGGELVSAGPLIAGIDAVCVAYSNAGGYVAVGCRQACVLFAVHAGPGGAGAVARLTGHRARVVGVVWAANDARLITAGEDGTLYQYELSELPPPDALCRTITKRDIERAATLSAVRSTLASSTSKGPSSGASSANLGAGGADGAGKEPGPVVVARAAEGPLVPGAGPFRNLFWLPAALDGSAPSLLHSAGSGGGGLGAGGGASGGGGGGGGGLGSRAGERPFTTSSGRGSGVGGLISIGPTVPTPANGRVLALRRRVNHPGSASGSVGVTVFPSVSSSTASAVSRGPDGSPTPVATPADVTDLAVGVVEAEAGDGDGSKLGRSSSTRSLTRDASSASVRWKRPLPGGGGGAPQMGNAPSVRIVPPADSPRSGLVRDSTRVSPTASSLASASLPTLATPLSVGATPTLGTPALASFPFQDASEVLAHEVPISSHPSELIAFWGAQVDRDDWTAQLPLHATVVAIAGVRLPPARPSLRRVLKTSGNASSSSPSSSSLLALQDAPSSSAKPSTPAPADEADGFEDVIVWAATGDGRLGLLSNLPNPPATDKAREAELAARLVAERGAGEFDPAPSPPRAVSPSTAATMPAGSVGAVSSTSALAQRGGTASSSRGGVLGRRGSAQGAALLGAGAGGRRSSISNAGAEALPSLDSRGGPRLALGRRGSAAGFAVGTLDDAAAGLLGHADATAAAVAAAVVAERAERAERSAADRASAASLATSVIQLATTRVPTSVLENPLLAGTSWLPMHRGPIAAVTSTRDGCLVVAVGAVDGVVSVSVVPWVVEHVTGNPTLFPPLPPTVVNPAAVTSGPGSGVASAATLRRTAVASPDRDRVGGEADGSAGAGGATSSAGVPAGARMSRRGSNVGGLSSALDPYRAASLWARRDASLRQLAEGGLGAIARGSNALLAAIGGGGGETTALVAVGSGLSSSSSSSSLSDQFGATPVAVVLVPAEFWSTVRDRIRTLQLELEDTVRGRDEALATLRAESKALLADVEADLKREIRREQDLRESEREEARAVQDRMQRELDAQEVRHVMAAAAAERRHQEELESLRRSVDTMKNEVDDVKIAAELKTAELEALHQTMQEHVLVRFKDALGEEKRRSEELRQYLDMVKREYENEAEREATESDRKITHLEERAVTSEADSRRVRVEGRVHIAAMRSEIDQLRLSLTRAQEERRVEAAAREAAEQRAEMLQGRIREMKKETTRHLAESAAQVSELVQEQRRADTLNRTRHILLQELEDSRQSTAPREDLLNSLRTRLRSMEEELLWEKKRREETEEVAAGARVAMQDTKREQRELQFRVRALDSQVRSIAARVEMLVRGGTGPAVHAGENPFEALVKEFYAELVLADEAHPSMRPKRPSIASLAAAATGAAAGAAGHLGASTTMATTATERSRAASSSSSSSSLRPASASTGGSRKLLAGGVGSGTMSASSSGLPLLGGSASGSGSTLRPPTSGPSLVSTDGATVTIAAGVREFATQQRSLEATVKALRLERDRETKLSSASGERMRKDNSDLLEEINRLRQEKHSLHRRVHDLETTTAIQATRAAMATITHGESVGGGSSGSSSILGVHGAHSLRSPSPVRASGSGAGSSSPGEAASPGVVVSPGAGATPLETASLAGAQVLEGDVTGFLVTPAPMTASRSFAGVVGSPLRSPNASKLSGAARDVGGGAGGASGAAESSRGTTTGKDGSRPFRPALMTPGRGTGSSTTAPGPAAGFPARWSVGRTSTTTLPAVAGAAKG